MLLTLEIKFLVSLLRCLAVAALSAKTKKTRQPSQTGAAASVSRVSTEIPGRSDGDLRPKLKRARSCSCYLRAVCHGGRPDKESAPRDLSAAF